VLGVSLCEKGDGRCVKGDLEHIWSRVQAELALALDEPTYRIWLAPLRARELSDERLLIEAPPQACGWIRDRFGRVLQAAAAAVLGPDAVVHLVPAQSSPRGAPGALRAGSAEDHGGAQEDRRSHPGAGTGPLGNPKLTFDQFVIGDCNRLAHAAALAVAELPAQAYNPLFVCGPPGVGKTHLLSAIANLLLSHSPELVVRATTGEAFTNEFLGALTGRRTDAFKARFRHIDVLLVDDVQFLERKAKTEEEFFHTFNALHDCGRQIVLTSDRPPSDLQALEDRLRERFQAGLVAEVKPPDLATRLAILAKRIHHDRIELADGQVLALIAERITDDIRSLEGALIRVVAYGSLTGRELTCDLARDVLDGLYPPAATALASTQPSIGEIQAATCRCFNLSPEELLSTSRTRRISWPRQLAMYLSRELTGESLPEIGRHFGGRNHTTVLHAWRRTASRLATDDSSRIALDKLRQNLNPDSS
jgi:chromosomal replication initiator protein